MKGKVLVDPVLSNRSPHLEKKMMKTSLSSLHKCDQCELNFLSKEGKEKHCARVHQVHHGQDVQQQHQVNKVQTPRFKIQAHQVEASPKLDCKQCGERFKTKADLQKHKATAKSVGTCLPCLKEKSKPRFTNMCEFTKHKKEHEIIQFSFFPEAVFSVFLPLL